MTVPAGVNDATFTLTTLAVGASSVVNITAAYGGVSANSPLTVNAAPATLPPGGGGSVGVINALTITPDTVFGGETALGTVTLVAGVTANTVVTLTSFDTTVATVPASVTVPAEATSATFTITTSPVFGEGTFSWINGNAGGQDRGASMNVNPARCRPPRVSSQSCCRRPPRRRRCGDGHRHPEWTRQRWSADHDHQQQPECGPGAVRDVFHGAHRHHRVPDHHDYCRQHDQRHVDGDGALLRRRWLTDSGHHGHYRAAATTGRGARDRRTLAALHYLGQRHEHQSKRDSDGLAQ